MSNSAGRDDRALWPWVTGAVIVLLLGVLFSMAVHRPYGMTRTLGNVLERYGIGGRTTITVTTDDGKLEAKLVAGLMTDVRWNGERVPEEHLRTDDGFLAVLDPDGRVLVEVPLGVDARATAKALGPDDRLGLRLAALDGGGLRVYDVLEARPGPAAGVRVGDVITTVDGQPAARMSMRAALISRIGGGPLPLELERDAGPIDVTLDLEPLMPPEELAGSHDPLGDWLDWEADRVARERRELERRTDGVGQRVAEELAARLQAEVDALGLDLEADVRAIAKRAAKRSGRSTTTDVDDTGGRVEITFDEQDMLRELSALAEGLPEAERAALEAALARVAAGSFQFEI